MLLEHHTSQVRSHSELAIALGIAWFGAMQVWASLLNTEARIWNTPTSTLWFCLSTSFVSVGAIYLLGRMIYWGRLAIEIMTLDPPKDSGVRNALNNDFRELEKKSFPRVRTKLWELDDATLWAVKKQGPLISAIFYIGSVRRALMFLGTFGWTGTFLLLLLAGWLYGQYFGGPTITYVVFIALVILTIALWRREHKKCKSSLEILKVGEDSDRSSKD